MNYVEVSNTTEKHLHYIEWDLAGAMKTHILVRPSGKLMIPIESGAEQKARGIKTAWLGYSVVGKKNLPETF